MRALRLQCWLGLVTSPAVFAACGPVDPLYGDQGGDGSSGYGEEPPGDGVLGFRPYTVPVDCGLEANGVLWAVDVQRWSVADTVDGRVLVFDSQFDALQEQLELSWEELDPETGSPLRQKMQSPVWGKNRSERLSLAANGAAIYGTGRVDVEDGLLVGVAMFASAPIDEGAPSWSMDGPMPDVQPGAILRLDSAEQEDVVGVHDAANGEEAAAWRLPVVAGQPRPESIAVRDNTIALLHSTFALEEDGSSSEHPAAVSYLRIDDPMFRGTVSLEPPPVSIRAGSLALADDGSLYFVGSVPSLGDAGSTLGVYRYASDGAQRWAHTMTIPDRDIDIVSVEAAPRGRGVCVSWRNRADTAYPSPPGVSCFAATGTEVVAWDSFGVHTSALPTRVFHIYEDGDLLAESKMLAIDGERECSLVRLESPFDG